MSEEEKGFVLKDSEEASDSGKDEEKDAGGGSEEPQSEMPLPEMNFATFVFSLNLSVLVHLGVNDDPVSGKKVKNMPIAKQTIDILGMLEEKTRGNLTDEEDKLLKNILHDLRMLYVKESGS